MNILPVSNIKCTYYSKSNSFKNTERPNKAVSFGDLILGEVQPHVDLTEIKNIRKLLTNSLEEKNFENVSSYKEIFYPVSKVPKAETETLNSNFATVSYKVESGIKNQKEHFSDILDTIRPKGVIISGLIKPEGNVFKKIFSHPEPVRMIYSYQEDNNTYTKRNINTGVNSSFEILPIEEGKTFNDMIKKELKSFSKLEGKSCIIE